MSAQIVVAGALIVGAKLLVAQRGRPPELAGRWELPGGKVGPGETDHAALARELAEELGIAVSVGPRVGPDIARVSSGTQDRSAGTQSSRSNSAAATQRSARWSFARATRSQVCVTR